MCGHQSCGEEHTTLGEVSVPRAAIAEDLVWSGQVTQLS